MTYDRKPYGPWRPVFIRLWQDEKFLALSQDARYLWLYLLTGPHTCQIPGLSCAGERGLAESLGWELKAFREAFLQIERKAMVEVDWKACVVWLPSAIKYDPPSSPNVVKSWPKAVQMIPPCDLRDRAIVRLGRFLRAEDFAEAFSKAFTKAFPSVRVKPLPKPSLKPLGNQEAGNQKQEAGVKETTATSVADDRKSQEVPSRKKKKTPSVGDLWKIVDDPDVVLEDNCFGDYITFLRLWGADGQRYSPSPGKDLAILGRLRKTHGSKVRQIVERYFDPGDDWCREKGLGLELLPHFAKKDLCAPRKPLAVKGGALARAANRAGDGAEGLFDRD